MRELPASAAAFFSGFYRNPEPRVVGEALLHVLSQPAPPAHHLLLMFARAVQLSEGVRAELEALASREAGTADTVAGVLAAAVDPAFPDAAKIPLTSPGDLDFVWGEFLLTGFEAPVRRIAGVLDGEDRMLAALTAWLAAPAYLPWSRSAKSRAIAALIAKGVVLDADRPRLGNEFDLDLLLWKLMSGGFKIREELPFAVPDALINHMMLKGAACWSLQSNANAHAVVRAVYDALPNRATWPRFVPEA